MKEPQAEVVVRRAIEADYSAFARLFPELLVDDPVPSPERWSTVLVPSTLVAARGTEVVGYCYFQEYADTGYIRHVVVAPSARNLGIGRALMKGTAEQLRSGGKRWWCLNVEPDNHAALALYARIGMTTQYKARALDLPWSAADSLPAGSADVRELASERHAVLEKLFDLPRGQLGYARVLGRMVFEAVPRFGGDPVGLAVFDPKLGGAFPFRVSEIDVATPLLAAMRPYVQQHDHVHLVVEDDECLASLLLNVGAKVRHEMLHLHGAL